MSSPALLAIAFTISLLCVLGMAYVLLRGRSSEQRIRRGLESAARETENVADSPRPPLQKALSWVRVNLSFMNQEQLRDSLRLAGLRAEWQVGAYQATRLLLPVLALACSTFSHK